MEIGTHEERLLTVQEVAQILKVPPSWVYEHIRERCPDRIPEILSGNTGGSWKRTFWRG